MQIQEERANYLYERILTPSFTWPETANIFETGTEYYRTKNSVAELDKWQINHFLMDAIT